MIVGGVVHERGVREVRDAEARVRSLQKSRLDHRAPPVGGRRDVALAPSFQTRHHDTSDREVAAVVNGDRHRRVPLVLGSRGRAIQVADMNGQSHGGDGPRDVAVAPALSVTASVIVYVPAAAYV